MEDPTGSFSESAFVRNCDARVHSLDTYTEPSLLAANTDAGELRWCKHEEGLMILIPHGWITSSVAPSRRENTIVVAGRALGGQRCPGRVHKGVASAGS